jgi:LysR family nitrogen assimilation transcriptional regulator
VELRQLRYFLRIVELGSFSKAARELYVAQPALSTQITNLETELGAQLLSRSVRGVSPTDAGKSLYLYAQSILRQIEMLREEVSAQSEQPKGPVVIGLPPSVASALAAPLVTQVRREFPQIQLKIVEGLSGHLEDLVSTGKLEMGLLFHDEEPMQDRSHSADRPVGRVAIAKEELLLFTAPNHPIKDEDPISAEDVGAMDLFLPGLVNVTRKIIERHFESKGVRLKIAVELDSLRTIHALVSAGLGGTILSRSGMQSVRITPKLAAHPIEGLAIYRYLSLCTPNVLAQSNAAKHVSVILIHLIKALIDSGDWPGATYLQDN